MRLLLIAPLALVACQSDLDPGESFASDEDSFAGIMEVLEQGMRPCTVEVVQPELEVRVLEACRERGIACYPAAQTEPAVDMQLVFQRVILHRPDVLRVRYSSVLPAGRWLSSAFVIRESGEWDGKFSMRSSGADYPRFDESDFR